MDGRIVLPKELDLPKNDLLKEKFAHVMENTPFGTNYGFRCIVVLDVKRISQSCGFSIPVLKYTEDRIILDKFCNQKGEDGMNAYRKFKNCFSIDGLPSIALLGDSNNVGPTAVEVTDGYILATQFGSSWWDRLVVRAQLMWSYSSWNVCGFTHRDALMAASGAVGAAAVMLIANRLTTCTSTGTGNNNSYNPK
jgi:hypothetical protein